MVKLADAKSGATESLGALARHAAWNYAALVLQLGGSFALVALAFRHLSHADVGIFALASVSVGLVQILDPASGYVMSRVVAEQDAGRSADGWIVPEIRAGLLTVAAAVGGLCVLGVGAAFIVHLPGLSNGRLVMITAVVVSACVQLASASLAASALGLGNFRVLCEASALTSVVTVITAWVLLSAVGVAALGLALLSGQLVGRGWLLIRRAPSGARGAQVHPPGFASVRQLGSHVGAIYLSSIAAQLLSVSDLWTVGVLKGAGSTAAYRAGSMIPSQSSSLFYRVYDVLYPRLPRMRDAADQERAVALATRMSCAAAGCLFTWLFLERRSMTHLLVGGRDSLTEQVFAVFCAIWLVNVPTHGLGLLLIARGLSRVTTPVVLVEAAVNILVSIGLVLAIGPIGAAVGTLATMAISNLVVMPWIIGRFVPSALRLTWSGITCCLLGVAVSVLLQSPPALALHGFIATTAVFAAAVTSVVVAVWLAAGAHGRRTLRAHV